MHGLERRRRRRVAAGEKAKGYNREGALQGRRDRRRKGRRALCGETPPLPNHTLAYPPRDPAYWQTAYLVYYSDVDADHAPTAICSWEHYPERIRWPAHYSREERPALYEREVRVTVPAGALLAYSMRTFHRGTPFRADGGRIGQFITYAPAAWKWLGITGWSAQAIRPEFRAWIEAATPEERYAFGFPAPGHPYWTEETLDGVAARYPGMDMAPYRDAARE